MDRLTERSENGKAVYSHPTPEPDGWNTNRAAVLERCCQYEDTGLTPEEIMDGRMLTGWIPVEERPPEDGTEVLVTVDSADGAFASTDIYSGGEWQDYNGVIAWMPLPEPYKPQALKPAGDYADNDTR